MRKLSYTLLIRECRELGRFPSSIFWFLQLIFTLKGLSSAFTFVLNGCWWNRGCIVYSSLNFAYADYVISVMQWHMHNWLKTQNESVHITCKKVTKHIRTMNLSYVYEPWDAFLKYVQSTIVVHFSVPLYTLITRCSRKAFSLVFHVKNC